VDVGAHIEALQRDGNLLADAAERAGLRAEVPSCPGWQVRDLLRHQGYVHSWAARHVAEQLLEPEKEPTEAEILAADPPCDAELLGWFRGGHAGLVRTLSTADPATPCWTFLPAPSPLAFWARRQAHETAIHRVDAELASGDATAFEAEFAADGIDELIMGFLGRDAKQLPADGRDREYRSLRVLPTDFGAVWQIDLTADGDAVRVRRTDQPAELPEESDCQLAGPAAGLYPLLWNRTDARGAGVTVSGDTAVLAAWRGVRVSW
jgi:uncharacterized protein (TIGR03083 family)